ncbi:nuclear cohesin-like protein complex subunit, partial [Amylocarpus encephaloides]
MDISKNDVSSLPAATGGRRKSGRTIKLPEKFVPDAPSSHTSAKRKRGGGDIENDASGVEDEVAEASDEPQESSAEEEERSTQKKPSQSKSKSARKPALKKPKVNGTASHEDALPLRLPNRPKKVKKVVIVDDAEEGLYGRVFSNDRIEDVVSEWLDRYRSDNVVEMADLINFILKCSGCGSKVTEDDINDDDNVEGRLSDIQQEFQAEGVTDYPLISKSPNMRGLRSYIVDFFRILVEALHASGLMYETSLLDTVHIWVAPLTSSPSRPFRHTATLIANTLTTALCVVAGKEAKAAGDTSRQLGGEKKNKKQVNQARLKEFERKVEAIEARQDLIIKLINEYFDTIWVHRYRDVDPKIRVECVEGLGSWIQVLPDFFRDGTYLRYMGWLLSDEAMPVRLEVLKQLEKVMKIPSNLEKMHGFIERFQARIIEMATSDADPTVRAFAVTVVDTIREAGLLEPSDIDIIGRLIFDAEPKVRKALVGFFSENLKDLYEAKIEELGGEEIVEEFLQVEDKDNFDVPRETWLRLKCFAEILQSYDGADQDEVPSQIDQGFLKVTGTESRFTLAAQALYEKIPELKEWEALAGYLLFDHSVAFGSTDTERALREAFRPTEKEELIMLETLNAIVKLRLLHAEDLDKNRRKPTRNEASEAREQSALHLAGLIPRLLKKYGADPKTAATVLRLEHVLNLGVFEELRQDSTAYSELLDEISAQFNSHADKGVLEEAGAALLHARGYEELEEVTETKIQSLWQDVTVTLQKFSELGKISARGTLSNKVLTELSHTLARLERLASISSCVEPLESNPSNSGPLPITILLDLIVRGIYEDSEDRDRDDLEDGVVISAMKSLMFYFMWKIKDLTEQSSAGRKIPDADIEQLSEWQETFVINLTSAFSSRGSPDAVRLLGSGTVLDVFVLFSTLRKAANSKDVDNSQLQTLITEITPEVQKELQACFALLEKEHAKKSRKKLEDPAEDEEPEDLDSEAEDEDNEPETENERQSEALNGEKQLCELTGKIVLAIVAKVIDATEPLAGKLKPRIQRNKAHLGPNFKGILAYLDEPKAKPKKSHKSKAQQAAIDARKLAKSKERVEESEEEDDPFEEPEPKEGTEDLGRGELIEEEDPPDSHGESGNGPAEADDEVDDEVMG